MFNTKPYYPHLEKKKRYHKMFDYKSSTPTKNLSKSRIGNDICIKGLDSTNTHSMKNIFSPARTAQGFYKKDMVFASQAFNPLTSRIESNKKVRELESIERKISSPKSIQFYRKKFASPTQKINFTKPCNFHLEDVSDNNRMFTTFLRATSAVRSNSKSFNKSNQRKEANWNKRFATPISKYNENVFRKYKLNFGDI